MIIRAEKRAGKTYIVERTVKGTVLKINNRNEIQSIKTQGETGYYYDEIAGLVTNKQWTVCILGAGGGTVARVLKDFGHRGCITGIEIDPFVIELGFLYFDAEKYDELIECDAKFFCRYTERMFDVVVDDVYVNSDQKVRVWAERIVRPGGLLITNEFPGVTAKVCT